MSRTAMKSMVAAILIILLNIGLFLFGFVASATFWISYIFMMLAALIASYVLIFYVNNKPHILVYELGAITVFYLFLAFITGIVSKNLLFLFPARAFFLQLCVFAFYCIAFLIAVIHGSHVGEQQQARATDIINFKYVLDQMQSAVSQMEYTHPLRKTVLHAYDSLASGQIRSNTEAFEVERNILDSVAALKTAITGKDDTKIQELCGVIETLAEERKHKLNMKSPF